ncbi:MAG TPA: DUF2274 domain-containing protein [Alphaproteobacteria bacterium]|nr:DUF2274 domain-containing protein [Alphaproteobacteria bacterium]
MARLKLGPLPDDRPVKLTIAIPADLKRALDAYAAAYAAESGRQWETKKLIPHILAAFLKSDKAFSRREISSAADRSGAGAPG